jgi:hypothetical protein
MSFKYNVFISHASEDKDLVARPISDALSKYGLKVWFDEMSLSIGDSLSRSIDRGLSESEFGIVILSPSFFEKNWPEYELRGLTARELRGKKVVILPIWHKVGIDDVIEYSPTLADKMAIITGHKTYDEISLKIIEVICPDLLTKIHRRCLYSESRKNSKDREVLINIADVKFGPLRHKDLPDSLISRIRFIRAALLGVYTHSMKFWLDGFRMDAHPSKEIKIWEHLASCYLEYTHITNLYDSKQRQLVFDLLLQMSFGSLEKDLEELLSTLPEDAFSVLSTLSNHKYPLYDIEEDFSESMIEKDFQEYPKELQNIDVEDYTSLDHKLAD